MSFSCRLKNRIKPIFFHKAQINKTKKSLRNNEKSLQISILPILAFQKSEKKMSLFAFRTGSLTIEMAIVLPWFLLAVLTILYTVEIYRVQDNINFGLQQTAKEFAKYAYIGTELENGDGELLQKLEVPLNFILSESFVREKVLDYAAIPAWNGSVIKNGVSGISFIQTKIMTRDGIIDLVADYQISLPFSIFFVKDYFVTQRARVHAWTGYEPLEEGQSAEQMVYITENGKVYHISRACTYLQLSVRQVEYADLKELRNDQGGKYYACERCAEEKPGRYVYITDTGDSYHNQITCSSLKRSIFTIPISEAGGRSMCSRCGK